MQTSRRPKAARAAGDGKPPDIRSARARHNGRRPRQQVTAARRWPGRIVQAPTMRGAAPEPCGRRVDGAGADARGRDGETAPRPAAQLDGTEALQCQCQAGFGPFATCSPPGRQSHRSLWAGRASTSLRGKRNEKRGLLCGRPAWLPASLSKFNFSFASRTADARAGRAGVCSSANKEQLADVVCRRPSASAARPNFSRPPAGERERARGPRACQRPLSTSCATSRPTGWSSWATAALDFRHPTKWPAGGRSGLGAARLVLLRVCAIKRRHGAEGGGREADERRTRDRRETDERPT